jgi:hypothetical protein
MPPFQKRFNIKFSDAPPNSKCNQNAFNNNEDETCGHTNGEIRSPISACFRHKENSLKYILQFRKQLLRFWGTSLANVERNSLSRKRAEHSNAGGRSINCLSYCNEANLKALSCRSSNETDPRKMTRAVQCMKLN